MNIDEHFEITGKMGETDDGDILVARRGRNGVVRQYCMRNPGKKGRTAGQRRHTELFKKAREEADRQLKDKSCRIRWEVSYKSCDGVFRGKKHETLRGFVVASCYQMVEEETAESG